VHTGSALLAHGGSGPADTVDHDPAHATAHTGLREHAIRFERAARDRPARFREAVVSHVVGFDAERVLDDLGSAVAVVAVALDKLLSQTVGQKRLYDQILASLEVLKGLDADRARPNGLLRRA
jgi:hypothetical protein